MSDVSTTSNFLLFGLPMLIAIFSMVIPVATIAFAWLLISSIRNISSRLMQIETQLKDIAASLKSNPKI